MKKGYKTYHGFGIERRFKDTNKRDDILTFLLCCIIMGVFMYFFFNLTGGFQC